MHINNTVYRYKPVFMECLSPPVSFTNWEDGHDTPPLVQIVYRIRGYRGDDTVHFFFVSDFKELQWAK